MTMTLDEAAIEARIGPASFQRGRSYFRNGAISATRRSGESIRSMRSPSTPITPSG